MWKMAFSRIDAEKFPTLIIGNSNLCGIESAMFNTRRFHCANSDWGTNTSRLSSTRILRPASRSANQRREFSSMWYGGSARIEGYRFDEMPWADSFDGFLGPSLLFKILRKLIHDRC